MKLDNIKFMISFTYISGELTKDDEIVETVAIKVLKNSASKEAEEDFMREVEIMSSFQHKNILSLLGVALKGKIMFYD